MQFNAQIGYICELREMIHVGHAEENVQLTVFVYSVNIFLKRSRVSHDPISLVKLCVSMLDKQQPNLNPKFPFYIKKHKIESM